MHMDTKEMLAIYIYTVSGNESNRRGQNIFKHSGETISRKFVEVLNALMAMREISLDQKIRTFPLPTRG